MTFLGTLRLSNTTPERFNFSVLCSFVVDCHTLHRHFFKTEVTENARRTIRQLKEKQRKTRAKCAQDVDSYRVCICDMLASLHLQPNRIPFFGGQGPDIFLWVQNFHTCCISSGCIILCD